MTTIDLDTINLDYVPEPAPEATEKQLNFIAALRRERDDSGMGPTPTNLDRKTASAAIDWLLARPRRVIESDNQAEFDLAMEESREARNRSTTRPEPLAEGIYVKDDHFYKVVRAVHGSGRLYVKEMGTDGKWFRTHATPSVYRLAISAPAPRRLEEHEAAAFGKIYGTCLICGRTLTDEDSIARGIGPVCAANQGW